MQDTWNKIKSVGLDVAESLTPVLKESKFRETVRNYKLKKNILFVVGCTNAGRVCRCRRSFSRYVSNLVLASRSVNLIKL